MSLDLSALIVEGVRLAFRTEGETVNCYLAPKETMRGALLISSMRKDVLVVDDGLWLVWRKVMDVWLRRLISDVIGVSPDSIDSREEEPREPPENWPTGES